MATENHESRYRAITKGNKTMPPKHAKTDSPRHAAILTSHVPPIHCVEDVSTALTWYLDETELATLHLALQDRENHLRALYIGNPPFLAEQMRNAQALHKRLITCTCEV
jgi:hypothetical protein